MANAPQKRSQVAFNRIAEAHPPTNIKHRVFDHGSSSLDFYSVLRDRRCKVLVLILHAHVQDRAPLLQLLIVSVELSVYGPRSDSDKHSCVSPWPCARWTNDFVQCSLRFHEQLCTVADNVLQQHMEGQALLGADMWCYCPGHHFEAHSEDPESELRLTQSSFELLG